MKPREMVEAMVSTQLEVEVLPMGKAVVTASERFTEQRAALVALLEAGAELRCDQPTDLDLRQALERYDSARAACERACGEGEMSVQDTISVTVTLTGRGEFIYRLLAVLRHVAYMGNVGKSRLVMFSVDGDGEDRLNVEPVPDVVFQVDEATLIHSKDGTKSYYVNRIHSATKPWPAPSL